MIHLWWGIATLIATFSLSIRPAHAADVACLYINYAGVPVLGTDADSYCIPLPPPAGWQEQDPASVFRRFCLWLAWKSPLTRRR